MSAQVQIASLRRFEGVYRTAAVSGVLTGVAAETATAGYLFAMRWAPTPPAGEGITTCLIQRLRARLTTIHGPTAAQEIGIDLTIARAFSASCSGGTALTPFTSNNAKKRTSLPAVAPGAAALNSFMTDMRVGNTGALTAGTQTLDTNPIASSSVSEAASAATVLTGFAEINIMTQDLEEYPIVLAPNEGLIIRNTILQGAGYTGRLVVEVDWREAIRV